MFLHWSVESGDQSKRKERGYRNKNKKDERFNLAKQVWISRLLPRNGLAYWQPQDDWVLVWTKETWNSMTHGSLEILNNTLEIVNMTFYSLLVIILELKLIRTLTFTRMTKSMKPMTYQIQDSTLSFFAALVFVIVVMFGTLVLRDADASGRDGINHSLPDKRN